MLKECPKCKSEKKRWDSKTLNFRTLGTLGSGHKPLIIKIPKQSRKQNNKYIILIFS